MSKASKVPGCFLSDVMMVPGLTIIARGPDGKETILGTALPKDFSTGSWGFYANGKSRMVVNGKTAEFQIGMNLTVINSKEWTATHGKEAPAPAAAAPASVTPSGPAALYDPTTKQGTLFPSSDMARSIKLGCPGGFYSRCEVITESSPEWTVAKQTCSIELSKGVAML